MSTVNPYDTRSLLPSVRYDNASTHYEYHDGNDMQPPKPLRRILTLKDHLKRLNLR